jgi:hypothetical protein
MNVVPRRQETLNWKYKGNFECNLSSVDIDVLKKHHGEACVEVFEGVEFPDKIKACDIFPHMLMFKKIKQGQDKLKDRETLLKEGVLTRD